MIVKQYIGAITALILLSGVAQSQTADLQQPLGDAAREQQELHPKAKNPISAKVYTDDDIAAQSNSAEDSGINDPPAVPELTQPGTDTGKGQAKPPDSVAPYRRPAHRQSVFDRNDNSADDVIVIPAGTEIQVNMVDRVVEAPVRVRFSTPIPALTKVALHIYGYHHRLSYSDNFEVGDYASIASVTIGDVTYPVQTDRVPCAGAGVFTLNAPLKIKR